MCSRRGRGNGSPGRGENVQVARFEGKSEGDRSVGRDAGGRFGGENLHGPRQPCKIKETSTSTRRNRFVRTTVRNALGTFYARGFTYARADVTFSSLRFLFFGVMCRFFIRFTRAREYAYGITVPSAVLSRVRFTFLRSPSYLARKMQIHLTRRAFHRIFLLAYTDSLKPQFRDTRVRHISRLSRY